MNEGMNESSMRCFDDSLIKKQGRTYSTDRSSLARYVDMSFFLAGSSKIFFIVCIVSFITIRGWEIT